MLKRVSIVLAAILLIASAALVLWQGSFNVDSVLRPEDPEQTFLFFGLQILIFLLMLGLGFMLIRLMIKLWIARQVDRAGSRIQTRLVMGALALSAMPVFFMVLFNYEVLNRTLEKWFNGPAQHAQTDLTAILNALEKQTRGHAVAEAQLIASKPETIALLNGSGAPSNWLTEFCTSHDLLAARILPAGSMTPVASFGKMPETANGNSTPAMAPVRQGGVQIGSVFVAADVPVDVIKGQKEIQDHVTAAQQLSDKQRSVKRTVLKEMTLIALFDLFVATWLAQYLARLISTPIAALLQAAGEVSHGNLAHRVASTGIDELAELVGGFNRMTADLEANRSELELLAVPFTGAGDPDSDTHRGHLGGFERRDPECQQGSDADAAGNQGARGIAAGRSFSAGRRHRDPLSDEPRAPNRAFVAPV